jgi:quinohemoprotein ethanol dehydrogenase
LRAEAALLLLVALCLVAPHTALAQTVVDGRTIADETSGANWLSYGRTYSEQRYSPLRQVNTDNVNQLGLAWSLDLPGQRTLEATPLAVDGVLYFSGTFGKTFAVDARHGTLLWESDPDLAHHSPEKLRIGMGAHRGVALWRGKVYVGLTDGRLVALDAKTGAIVWSVQTFDEKARKSLSGAPRVFNGKVIIGHGGADYGTRGYVTVYDAETGRQLWRFYTVPGDPKNGFEDPAMRMAAATWDGEWWRWGGGGTVWDNITYDPKFNRVYLAVGNGSPWNANIRSPGSGDNLFLCSIVALDADSGRYVWHYQINPRDSWDYDATQQMVLADLSIAGKRREVLMQAPKNGFYYVIDRRTGKLLSAEKFAKVTWAERIDLVTGRPVEMNNLRYEKGPVEFWPSSAGAHNFQPMSFNPGTGLVYIPTMKTAMRIASARDDRNLQDFDNEHRKYFPVQASESELIKRDPDDGTAGLLAWDPVAQKKRWEAHYADSFWNGGTMTTAGNLLFQGTGRGQFLAYDARSGKKLWSFDTDLGVIAAPATYEVDGVQYISLLVGYGGSAGNGTALFDYGWRFNEQPRRLLTFALNKHEPLPPTNPPRFALRAVDNPTLAIDSKIAADGEKVYHSSCFLCHGAHLQSTGSIAPDLRESRIAMNWDSFTAVVHEGTLAGAGMPKYADLTETDVRALYMYIRRMARDSLTAPH